MRWLVLSLLLVVCCLPSLPCQTARRKSEIVRFSKKMYSSVMGAVNATTLAEGLSGEFNKLNTDGTLGGALRALYDMHVQDLQVSLQNARKMREVLDLLDI
jgi:hypothetical protein